MYYELQPAYGRDYKTSSEVVKDFTSGKDFLGDYQLGFQLMSIRDLKPGDKVLLRYKQLRSVVVHTVPVTAASPTGDKK
jgi:hypothetical protein